MAAIKNFEDMAVWKEARIMVFQIYEVTRHPSFSRDFQFIDHIRRTAISIPSNISEGFERDGNKEFTSFLSIAKGSCGELRCQLYIALDQKYLDQQQFDHIYHKLMDISKSISNLMKYLQNCNYKGRKFK
jgi:four helix bundle protein